MAAALILSNVLNFRTIFSTILKGIRGHLAEHSIAARFEHFKSVPNNHVNILKPH